MRWIHAVAAAVAATGVVGSVAKATLTVSLVPIQITSAAMTADPALANARSYDLEVTQAGGEIWNVTTLQMHLAQTGGLSGSFYQSSAALVSNGAHVFQQGFANTTPQFYDTSFNVPMNQSARTTILGNSDYPNTAGAGSVATQTSTDLSVAWGDQESSPNTTTNGTYSIGRITVLGNTGSYFNGYVAGNINLNTKQQFSNVYLPILGDVDGDGAVGGSDFTTVQNNFGNSVTVGTGGDVDNNGVVGGSDFTIVQNEFGNTITPGQASTALGALVPEPMSLGLVGGLAALFGTRRRRA